LLVIHSAGLIPADGIALFVSLFSPDWAKKETQ